LKIASLWYGSAPLVEEQLPDGTRLHLPSVAQEKLAKTWSLEDYRGRIEMLLSEGTKLVAPIEYQEYLSDVFIELYSPDGRLLAVFDTHLTAKGDTILITKEPISARARRSGVAIRCVVSSRKEESFFLDMTVGTCGCDLNMSSTSIIRGDMITFDSLELGGF